MEGVGRLGVCTQGGGEQSLLPEGSGSHCTEALGLWGTGERTAPPSLNFFPSQTGPLFVWQGGQRERGEASAGSYGERQGPGKGDVLQSSVIPLALSSSCTRVRYVGSGYPNLGAKRNEGQDLLFQLTHISLMLTCILGAPFQPLPISPKDIQI